MLLGSTSVQTVTQSSFETITLSKPISTLKSICFLVINPDNIHIYNTIEFPVIALKNITSSGYATVLGADYSVQCYYISDTKLGVKQTRATTSQNVNARVDIYGY